MKISPIRVRFAPSPTGWLHVGGARTALFNYLFARKHAGAFLLRIEDTDKSRSDPRMTQAILDSLDWLGLQWDEPEFYQSRSEEEQHRHCLRLVEEGKAYRCFCPPRSSQDEGEYLYNGNCRALREEEITAKLAAGMSYTIRFKTPPGETGFNDLVAGEVTVKNEEIGDFIILRSDGSPIYQVAVVCDDHRMGISHVIRGADHLSNTPKQILLYRAFGYEVPVFAHVPLILGPDKKRLSKRHGAASVGEYRRAGYLPEALLNYLALLGWSPGDNQELLPLSEMIELFSMERISGTPAVFDEDKLAWMNGIYLQQSENKRILTALRDLAAETSTAAGDWLEGDEQYLTGIVELIKPRAKRLTDFFLQAGYFFHDPSGYDEETVQKRWRKAGVTERLRSSREKLESLSDWNVTGIEDCVRGLAEEEGVGAGHYVHPLRLALTGSGSSPGLFEIMALLGRKRVVRRIDTALQWLAAHGA